MGIIPTILQLPGLSFFRRPWTCSLQLFRSSIKNNMRVLPNFLVLLCQVFAWQMIILVHLLYKCTLFSNEILITLFLREKAMRHFLCKLVGECEFGQWFLITSLIVVDKWLFFCSLVLIEGPNENLINRKWIQLTI